MQAKRGLELGRPFGSPLLVHRSWFPAGALLAAHLAITVFGPDALPVAVLLGIITAALVFGSVLVHELAHLAARHALGIRTADVTLLLFGGVARTSANTLPRAEAVSAFAGPLASAALGTIVLLLSSVASGPIGALFKTVAVTNLVLAGLHLLPIEPFDGGRLTIALSQALTGRRSKGARFAARGGEVFGAAGMFAGLWIVVTKLPDKPHVAAGVWLGLVGIFVFSEATRMRRARVVADRLEGATAGGWAEPFTGRVRAETPVPAGGGPYAVSEGGRLAGILVSRSVQLNPGKRVGDVMIPWTPNISLPAEAPLSTALERLASSGSGALVVLDAAGVVRGVLDEESVRNRLKVE